MTATVNSSQFSTAPIVNPKTLTDDEIESILGTDLKSFLDSDSKSLFRDYQDHLDQKINKIAPQIIFGVDNDEVNHDTPMDQGKDTEKQAASSEVERGLGYTVCNGEIRV